MAHIFTDFLQEVNKNGKNGQKPDAICIFPVGKF